MQPLDIRLLYITQARYAKDWVSHQHFHHYTELIFVTKGKGRLSIDGKILPIKENDLIIVNPYVTHSEDSQMIDPLEYIILGVSGLEFSNLQGSDSFKVHSFERHRTKILFYLNSIFQDAQNKPENYELICQHLLQILVLSIARQTHAEISVVQEKKIMKECRFIEHYLDEHYREDISIQTLCELTNLNKYYLIHSFKHYMGVSPINYVIKKRIAEAKNLLATTNYTISKISNVLGFSSQSYFSQVFRKETSMTPNEYRRAQQKK
jgi:AraC-like DNA-binding protein